jgi:3-deoxy-D-manno-octulosonic-acid transferase
MATTSWSYRAALRLGAALAPALGRLDNKIRTGDQARRGAGDRLLDWARWNREATRPLAWFHAASVGEGLQAESVLQEFRRLRPECQIIYTHFSPSAEALARRLDVDTADYLPYDLPDTMDRLLASLEPDLLVFSKLDVWPELSTRAATSGAQVTIVAATVSPASARLRWPARWLLEPGYRVMAAAAAISAQDSQRLARIGVPAERIQVLGDPRFDSVAARVHTVRPDDPLLRFGQGASTMVAGSTWAPDEEVLLGAFSQLHRSRPDARLILVPHEPTPAHLAALDLRCASLGLPRPVRLSEAQGPVPLMVADRIGLLATLYGGGTMAYVGGGFGTAGLHSVLEPAAWSIPVAFGPRWRNSRDAALLLDAAAASALPHSSMGRARVVLQQCWEKWIVDAEERKDQGRRARAVVDRGLGASRRSAEMLAGLISARRPQRSPRGAQSARPSTP